MPAKVKIIFSFIIIFICWIICGAFYVDYKEYTNARKFGIKEKALVVKKYKEKTVVSKSYNFTSRGKTPITTSKYFKHYVIVRYPISDSKNELLELFNKNNHVLSFLTKESFDAFNEGETIDIIHYNRNNNEHILLAFEVENPPFFNSHYYLFFIIGFIISLLVYRKL